MTVESWATESVADCLVPVSVTGKAKIQSRDYKPSGRFPVIDQGQEPIAGWTDDESAVIDTPLPLIVFGDHTIRQNYHAVTNRLFRSCSKELDLARFALYWNQEVTRRFVRFLRIERNKDLF